MSKFGAIFRREVAAYFATPVAYVFGVIFLFLTGIFTFYMGDLYGRGQADLDPFFTWHPWLYLFLIPALAMRLWAEERRSGTIELLMTLPVSVWQVVLGKFFAAWFFTAIALALTFPVWITVIYLGDTDNGVFVAVNVLSQTVLRHARLDLPEDGLFTLSDGTRNILGALDEPLTVRFFISQKLANEYPPIRDYATRVLELLEEYVAAADGMIELSVIDPEPFTDAEDDAVGFGLQGATVNNVGDQLYFGMVVTNTTDDQKVVPFFQQDREAFLEYDLTSLFHDLANPKKSVVGLISSLPVAGGAANPPAPQQGMSQPWSVVLQVQKLFELRDLGEVTGPIADDIDVLLIIHPKDMPPAAQFAIDQYVLGGG